ncbi:MAG: hypothetical protein K0S58_3352 [Nitrospira sp.]|jgi:hypothetical protein|nr:hypothetical protein [Nitrospira sp.]
MTGDVLKGWGKMLQPAPVKEPGPKKAPRQDPPDHSPPREDPPTDEPLRKDPDEEDSPMKVEVTPW